MNVRVWEPGSAGRGRIARFLSENHIHHSLLSPAELRGVQRPALEVNGEIFIDPNEHAMRRLLGLV